MQEISSIAFNKKVLVVDGNVLRVVSREMLSTKDVLEAKTKKEFTEKLLSIMPIDILCKILYNYNEIKCFVWRYLL